MTYDHHGLYTDFLQRRSAPVDNSPNHVASALPPAPGEANPYWVAVMALALGSQGLFGNSSLTQFTSSPNFQAVAAIGLTATDSSPLDFQQLKWLYHAAFGNTTVDKVHGLMAKGLDHRNKFDFQIHSYSVLLSITVLAVILRFWGKLYVLTGRLRLDDWLLLFGFLLDLGPIIWYLTVLSKVGGIQHVWDVPYPDVITTARTGYVGQILQVPSIYLIKLSFLVFYQTLSSCRRNRLIILVTGAVITVGSVVLMFMSIFQCTPVPDYWNNLLLAKCISRSNLVAATSVFYMVSDFVVLIIPTIIVSHLELPFYKKLSVYGLFLLGIITCAFSAVRVRKSVQMAMSIDLTWQQYEFGIWSQLEVDMGVIVSCLPTIRAMLVTAKRKASEARGSWEKWHPKEIISTIASGRRTLSTSISSKTRSNSERVTPGDWRVSRGDFNDLSKVEPTSVEQRSSRSDGVLLDDLAASARLSDEEEGMHMPANFNFTSASTTDEADSDIVRSVIERDGDNESNASSSRRPSGLSPRPSTSWRGDSGSATSATT